MRLRIRLSLLLSAALLPVALPATQHASAACTSSFTKYLSGSIQGTDTHYVDALVGFDIYDANNIKIGMDGCRTSGSYSVTLRINQNISAYGTTNPTAVTKSWALHNVPANATHVYIEVYPKDTGPYGLTSEVRYGKSYRRSLSVPLTAISLRLPLICGSGGTTGDIYGKVYVNGAPATAARVATWSSATDTNNTVLGWNLGSVGSGWYKIQHLVSGQYYIVWITPWSGAATTKHYNVLVNSCKTTPLSFSFTR